MDLYCQSCHDIDNDVHWNFEKKWPQIIHTTPAKEKAAHNQEIAVPAPVAPAPIPAAPIPEVPQFNTTTPTPGANPGQPYNNPFEDPQQRFRFLERIESLRRGD